MPATTQTFAGFRPEAIQFLADLRANNERAWFQARKSDFDRLLKEPLEAFCVALGERFAAHDVPLRADPARSPFRIYRDVRFAKDKSPYKTNIGASFPWVEGRTAATADGPAEPERHGVGGYFHFAPDEIFVGGGMWHPEPARLAAFRQAILDEPSSFRRLLEERSFARVFKEVHGDRLKRAPAGVPPDHPEIELLKLKDVGFGRTLSADDAFSPELPEIVARDLAVAKPVFRFLARLSAP